jgi:hypothetical protein
MATGTTDALLEHALKNNGHRCFCNHPLTFEPKSGGLFSCHCERCERRAVHIDGVVHVFGYGADSDLAFADWLEVQRRM